MTEPNIHVTDLTKEVTCGDVSLRVHMGDYGYVRLYGNAEIPFGQIPNLIAALHTADDIAAESSAPQALRGQQ